MKTTNQWGRRGRNREQTFYYHYDGLGNVTGLTNHQGREIAEYSYDAYGNVLLQEGDDRDNPYQFSTKELVPQANLYYFGARFYNPKLGRFITPDPLGFVDGPNMYGYCSNNPVNLIDPWGLCEKGLGASGSWDEAHYDFLSRDFWSQAWKDYWKGFWENLNRKLTLEEIAYMTMWSSMGVHQPEMWKGKAEKPKPNIREDKPPSKPHYDKNTGQYEPEHWHKQDYNYNPKTGKWEPGKWKYGGPGKAP